ncbi:MAG: hypothetical protein HZA51_16115 [Planctomycetes bacterium]|nr:hypothetical protein [Planctomycetota bacterium]
MLRLRIPCGMLIVMLCALAVPVRADDETPADRLAEAVKLYDKAKYQDALNILSNISADDLEEEDQQLQFQRYTDMAKKAVDAIADAKAALSAGDAAMKDKKWDAAKAAYDKVIVNKFATPDQKDNAKLQLDEIENQTKAEDPSRRAAKSEPVETVKSTDNTSVRISDDIRTQPAVRSSNGGSSIVEQLAEEHELLWQQAARIYRDTESKIRKAVLAEDFDEARRILDFAKQTLEMNRRYASPPSRYEDLRIQASELEKFLDDEQRDFDEREIQKKHQEIEQQEAERTNRIRATKLRQVEQLMQQAAELRKERRYDDAIQVLKQVLAIDPENSQAAWMKDTIEDFSVANRDRGTLDTKSAQTQDLLIENHETLIPWHKDVMYPKNWPEIASRRTGSEESAESDSTRVARKKLQAVASELVFEAKRFEDVIENLRALTGLNIVPNWAALSAAAIEKEAEVNLKLQGVKYEKALQLILNAVGGGETELAYEIDDGVVTVSTKEDLSRNKVTRVYNVQDLIITVPTFRSRFTPYNVPQSQNQQGGLGGGRFLFGGGQGGQGGGGQQQGGGQQGGQQQENQQNLGDPLEPLMQLIQQTIDPESWRDAGGNVGAISALQNQVIVTQTTTAHGQLRDLLRQLRQARAMQVAVEARYITITRNWLEQIGVDLDVVLNNGNAGFDRTTIRDPATGNPILVPRQFVRNGYTPGAPGNVGINLPTQPFAQPYGQPGLVPASGNVGPASGSFTPIPIVNNTLALATPSDTNINGSLGSLVNSSPAFQVFGSFLDNIQVDFLLRATQVDRRASDLDAPRLVLFNGQRATFEAFVQRDYIAALTPIIGDNAGAFLPGVATAPTGRSLDVQATISADHKYVTMTVRTFTTITGDFRTVFFGGSNTVGSGFIELATLTTQDVRTTVSVPDGGTLLIGGLKLSAERDVDAGVPILSRIPVLKRAFSNTSNVKDDQVLLILIKPTIIIQEEAEAEAFPTLSSAGR